MKSLIILKLFSSSCLSLFDKNKPTCSSVNYALYKTLFVPKYTLRNFNDWMTTIGYQYNSSQAVSHEIYDFFCTSFLNLDFAQVFRPRSANSCCTLGSTKTFQKESQFL